MKNSKRYISIAILLIFVSFNLAAQEKLDRDSFVIVKEFVPTLSQSAKIRINPEIQDTHHLDLNLKYDFLQREIETDFHPEPIKAAKLKGEPLVKLHRNYLILGYGNNNTPLAEYYFNQLRSKKVSYSVSGRHLSSNGISDIENSDFSHNKIGLTGNYYTRKWTFSGRMNYRYDHVNYYGFDAALPGLDIPTAELNQDVLQFYNSFDIALGLGNNQRDTIGLRHYSEISYKSITDRFGAGENRFILKENMSLLKDGEVYTFDWAIDYNKYFFDDDVISLDSNYENTIVYLKPGIELKGNRWNLYGALNVAAELAGGLKIRVYPVADFRYHLIKNILIPYAGITGNLHRNTYAGFTDDNPFISPVIALQNTRERFTFYGGLGGNLSKNTSFDLSFTRSTFLEMPLYVKDTNSRENRGFVPVYDNVDLTKVTGEIIYEPGVKWELVLRGDYFMYNTTNELEAWHKPDYRVSLLAGYNLGDKILVKLMTYFIGSQQAKTFDPEGSKTLAGTADVNLDFEYRYTKKLSVFLDINNIASIRYEKWQDYPTQRLNVLAGFKFSF